MALALEQLPRYLAVGGIAFVTAVAATPIAIALARRLDVMDHPDTFLKPHARPTPYLGGVAIALGWLAAMVAAVFFVGVPAAILLPTGAVGLAFAVIGAIDDARHIPPKIRLLLSAALTAIVIFLTPVGLSAPDNLLNAVGLAAPMPIVSGLAALLGTFIVLGACNSTNLIDGLDGLCAGVTSIIGFGFFLLAADMIGSSGPEPMDIRRLATAIAMCGAALGFLVWNYNPARIFMGDAGSLLLGYCSGLLILSFGEARDPRWFLAAITMFTVPVFDTVLAMLRRYRSGKPIFQGDRSHFYDQLVQRGFSVRQTGLICYVLTGITVATGLALGRLPAGKALAGFVGMWALIAVLAVWAGFTSPERRPAATPATT